MSDAFADEQFESDPRRLAEGAENESPRRTPLTREPRVGSGHPADISMADAIYILFGSDEHGRRPEKQSPAFFGSITMTEQPGNGANTAQGPLKFSVLAQYTKDLSFENPNAPKTLGQQQSAPSINVQINVNTRQLAPTDYEVTLMLEGGAGFGGDTLFKFELSYAGLFRVENFPEDQIQPVVMIEGPRILFPFARQIVADAVRSGSYPPLYIDPIDFQALYFQRLAANGQSLPPTA